MNTENKHATTSTTDLMVDVQAVERRFSTKKADVHALGPIDLQIRSGEFRCIVGPSGCGKSTLLRILAGLIRPTAGYVEIHRTGQHSLTSVVFQDYSIYPWKTVEDNVALGLRYEGVRKGEARDRARTWIERVGLTEFARSYPQTLSGGMKQRVSLARAFAVEPEVLLMDEPFAALDAQLRTVMQEELLALWQSDRRTVIFITHSLDEAILLGDRVAVMSARPGKIVAEFDVPFERPRHPDLRGEPEFGRLEQEIWSILRHEVTGPRIEVAS